MHELRRRELLHISRVMNEHSRIAIDKGPQDAIILSGDESDRRFDHLVLLLVVGDAVDAQVIIESLYDLTHGLAMQLSIFDILDGGLSPDRLLLDELMSKVP